MQGASAHPQGPHGHVALLRLQHGQLLESLAGDRTPNTKSAAHIPHQLVFERRERKVHMARLWRKHAGAPLDYRAGAR